MEGKRKEKWEKLCFIISPWRLFSNTRLECEFRYVLCRCTHCRYDNIIWAWMMACTRDFKSHLKESREKICLLFIYKLNSSCSSSDREICIGILMWKILQYMLEISQQELRFYQNKICKKILNPVFTPLQCHIIFFFTSLHFY